MRRSLRVGTLAAALCLAGAAAFAQSPARPQVQSRGPGQQLMILQGTEVLLAFDQPLNSRTARAGQQVRLHVVRDVVVGNRILFRAGTPVTGAISRVDRRTASRVRADLRLAIDPVCSPAGVPIPLAPRTQGGVAVSGPTGMVGGYFVRGRPVGIEIGDQLDTAVARTITLSGAQASGLPAASVSVAALPPGQPSAALTGIAVPSGPAAVCPAPTPQNPAASPGTVLVPSCTPTGAPAQLPARNTCNGYPNLATAMTFGTFC